MADAGSSREVESLNGSWHTWLDEAVDWEREMPFPPDTPTDRLPVRAPSAGWDGMEWGMESTRVPGLLAQARPGYHGVAWQWRPIVIPDHWQRRLVYLCFGGARQRIEVYLDDRPIGYDLDGLTPFRVDLTPHVRPGGQYELALRVTNPGGWQAGEGGGAIRWGDAALPGSPDVGGLWGGVGLLALPRVHIERVFVHAGVSLDGVTARVVWRGEGVAAGATMRLSVLGVEGHSVAATTVDISRRAPSDRGDALEVALPMAGVQRWTPESPRLYRVVVEVQSDHGVDRVEASLGLRRVEERDGRLVLEGKPVATNPALFDAVEEDALPLTPRAAQRAVTRALSAGVDGLVAVRWPAPPELLDACDGAGLPVVQTLVGVEDPAAVPVAARPLFEALARERVRRLIRRDRNHPCIVAWRLPMAKDAGSLSAYAQLIRALDPTRPIITAP